jgi:uncharacterized protein (DUF2249 family)
MKTVQAAEVVVLDVREVAPRERHTRIFATLAELSPGGVVNLLVDHEPRPLWYQLQAEQPGQFAWTYLEEGPELWHVRITRLSGETKPAPIVLDNRGLEPPQPLVRTLEALAQLQEWQQLIALMDREPVLLYPQLASRGFGYATSAQTDGGYQVRIWRDA